MQSNDQLADFQARLKQIRDPQNTQYHDANSGMMVPKRLSQKDIRSMPKAAPTLGLIGLLLAGLVGALSFVIARFARYAIFELPHPSDTVFGVELSLAVVVAFVIGGIIGQTSLRHMSGQVIGVAVMAAAMHNLVWLAPDAFSQYFSQVYVDQVHSTTQPASVVLRGRIFTL